MERYFIYITNVSFSGKVGIVIDTPFYQPESNKTEDIVAAETAHQFTVRYYLEAIFLSVKYATTLPLSHPTHHTSHVQHLKTGQMNRKELSLRSFSS